MAYSRASIGLACLVCVLLLVQPSHAFGAGNIGSTSKVEGQNWRHGDIEDTLLAIMTARAFGGKKFSKLDVKRVSRPQRSAWPWSIVCPMGFLYVTYILYDAGVFRKMAS